MTPGITIRCWIIAICLVLLFPTLHLTVRAALSATYMRPSLQEIHKVVSNFPWKSFDNAVVSDHDAYSGDANINLDNSVRRRETSISSEADKTQETTDEGKHASFKEREEKDSEESSPRGTARDKFPASFSRYGDGSSHQDHNSVIRLDNTKFRNRSTYGTDSEDDGESNNKDHMCTKEFHSHVTAEYYSRDEANSHKESDDVYNRVTPTFRKDLMLPAQEMPTEFTTAGRRGKEPPSASIGPGMVAISVSKNISCHTHICRCNQHKKRALCFGRQYKLRYIPSIPAYVTRFAMRKTNLRELTRQKLCNLSNFDVQTMNLQDNQITFLAKDTFVDFTHLQSLDLGRNPISAKILKDAFYSIHLSNFESLGLDSMLLYNLPKDFLGAFGNRSIKSISMTNNNLTTFDGRVFSQLVYLGLLVISDNYISNFLLNNTVHVKKMKLERNALRDIPFLCKPTSDTAFPDLVSLNLAGNQFRRMPAGAFKGRCLPKLRKLDVGSSSLVEHLENNFVSDLPQLQKLMVGDMKSLKLYNPFCFNSSSLESLYLAGNKVWTQGTVFLDEVFAHAPNLRIVDLTKTKFDLNTEEDLPRILLPAKSLVTLRMASCLIGSLPADTLSKLPNLRWLDLTANHVTTFSLAGALRNVIQLHTLILQANKITAVDETTFPPEFLQSIRVLNLGFNDFACTCDLLWFKSWIELERRSRNVTFPNYPKELKCRSPDKYKGLPIANYNPSYRECHPLNVYVVGGSVAGVIVLATAVSLALTYRYRWYLRYYIYRLRRRRNYEHLSDYEDEDGILYDVYIAYSQFDVDWVVHELAPILEASPYVENLFIKDRDQGAGPLADNIVRFMDQSSRIVLVLSDGYTREGWSGYEFNNVIYAANEQHKDVIVILKGDVEAGRLTKDMRRLLTGGTFLHWERAEEARDTFRDALTVALRTRGNFQELV